MKTKVFLEEYKGYPMFAVWEVDENGNKVGSYPVISLGSKKARVLAEHLDALRVFARGGDEGV